MESSSAFAVNLCILEVTERGDSMKYAIEGGNLPVLKVSLGAGESAQCEAGAMLWMDNEIEMRTSSGGIGKMFGRMVTNENGFLNTL